MSYAEIFADTCVIGELNGQIVGLISASCKPKEPDCLFVWQVAVAVLIRKQKVASRMLDVYCVGGKGEIEDLETGRITSGKLFLE